MPAQSTFRRYVFVTCAAYMIVSGCTIAYLANHHVDVSRSEHFTELTRRAVGATALLELLPDPSSVSTTLDAFALTSTTSNRLTFTLGLPVSSVSFQRVTVHAEYPYSVSVPSTLLNGTVSLSESHVVPPAFSCRPLTVGQGLCLLLCSLSATVMLLQLGNLVAQRAQKYAAVAICCFGHVVGIAFIVGTVVLMGSTHRQCSLYHQGEDMHSTALCLRNVFKSLVTTDYDAVSASVVSAGLSRIETMFNNGLSVYPQRTYLRFGNETFPSQLPYYHAIGGAYVSNDDYTIIEHKGASVVATVSLFDSITSTLFYIQETQRPPLLDEAYVSYGMQLGVIPYVVVMVASLVMLPYQTLGALENGDVGLWPWQWRMSRYAGDVKFCQGALVSIVVLSMCSISLTASYGNLALSEYVTAVVDDVLLKSGRTRTGADGFLFNLVSAASGQVGTDVNPVPAEWSVPSDFSTIRGSFYPDLQLRWGAFKYNRSSVRDELANMADPPLLHAPNGQSTTLSDAYATYLANRDVPESTLLYLTLLTWLADFHLLSLSLSGNLTSFTTAERDFSDRFTVASLDAGFSPTTVATFLELRTQTMESVVAVSRSYAKQIYHLADLYAFFTSDAAKLVTAEEDAVIAAVTGTLDSQISFSPRISAPFAAYQTYCVLAVTLPAVILLLLAFIWDSYYTHYFFALNHKWVPSSDSTTVNKKLRPPVADLSSNLRVTTAALLVVLALLVILLSVEEAQSKLASAFRSREVVDVVFAAGAKYSVASVLSRMYFSSYFWLRTLMSNSESTLNAVTRRLQYWYPRLSQLTISWTGLLSSRIRDAVLASVAAETTVLRTAAVTCLSSQLSTVADPFSQMTDVFAQTIANPVIRTADFVACLSPEDAVLAASAIQSATQAVVKDGRGHDTSTDIRISQAITVIQNILGSTTFPANCTHFRSYLVDVVQYFPVVHELFRKDYRVSIPSLGLELAGNSTMVEAATSELIGTLSSASVPTPGTYAVFWVPVVCLWGTLILLHFAYQRSSHSMRAMNSIT